MNNFHFILHLILPELEKRPQIRKADAQCDLGLRLDEGLCESSAGVRLYLGVPMGGVVCISQGCVQTINVVTEQELGSRVHGEPVKQQR